MAALDGLPPLREVIARYGLDALKSLGQNFLLDLNITQKVARTAGNHRDQDHIGAFEPSRCWRSAPSRSLPSSATGAPSPRFKKSASTIRAG